MERSPREGARYGFSALAAIAVVAVAATPARGAEPFSNAEQFTGPSVKPGHERRSWELGVRLELAPIRSAVRQRLAGVFAERNLDELRVHLPGIDPRIIEGGSGAEMTRALMEIPTLDADQRRSIREALVEGPPEENLRFVRGIHDLAPLLRDGERSTSYSLAPFARYDLGLADLRLELPIVGFAVSGRSDFALGNVNLDVRFGHHWGDWTAFGLTWGLAVYLPSASARAATMALWDPLDAPRFSRHYMTLAPYVALGIDLFDAIALQFHGELVGAFGVRDRPPTEAGFALGWGAAVLFDVHDAFAVSFELDGAHDLADAADFDASHATFGLRGDISGLRLGAAVELPLSILRNPYVLRETELATGAAQLNVLFTAAVAW